MSRYRVGKIYSSHYQSRKAKLVRKIVDVTLGMIVLAGICALLYVMLLIGAVATEVVV